MNLINITFPECLTQCHQMTVMIVIEGGMRDVVMLIIAPQ